MYIFSWKERNLINSFNRIASCVSIISKFLQWNAATKGFPTRKSKHGGLSLTFSWWYLIQKIRYLYQLQPNPISPRNNKYFHSFTILKYQSILALLMFVLRKIVCQAYTFILIFIVYIVYSIKLYCNTNVYLTFLLPVLKKCFKDLYNS